MYKSGSKRSTSIRMVKETEEGDYQQLKVHTEYIDKVK